MHSSDVNDVFLCFKAFSVFALILLCSDIQSMYKISTHSSKSHSFFIINKTKGYKYFGVEVNLTLNLNSYSNKRYKNMTLRLRLLSKLRSDVTASTVASVYNMVTMILFSRYSLMKPTLTQTQINRILLFEQDNVKRNELNWYIFKNKESVYSSTQSSHGRSCDQYENYFEFLNTTVKTRNKNILFHLPNFLARYFIFDI